MRFTKMHGLGNDYVYVSLFDQSAPADPAELSRVISDRHFGIGSDGLILIEPSDRAEARMRMFNADGSESEMCGNGVRCVAKYINDHGITAKNVVTIETGRGVLTLELEREGGKVRRVKVDMGTPILEADAVPTSLPGAPPLDVPVHIAGRMIRLTALSMGNPHAVTYVGDVSDYPVGPMGQLIEMHEAFPRRVNAHFVEVLAPNEVRVRTWERGSGITLACGTGACAVCVAGVLTGRTERYLLAHLPGGDLELEWPANDASVFMTGPAAEVYTGEWLGMY